MKGQHPKRRKDKYNPYTLYEMEGHFFISFKDGQGKLCELEVSEQIYRTFDRFELDDLVYLNVWDRHIEQSEVKEGTLNNRPVLVIQNDIGNFQSPTIIVAALSAQIAAKAVLPTHYIIGECAGLDEKTMVLLEQIRTIDKKRIRYYVGKLSGKDMEQVERCLAVSLDLKII